MAWKQIEATGPHLTYLVLSFFLISYALFSLFIRNRLHLAEPPLATLVGIICGPKGVGLITPEKWGLADDFMQEFTRVVVGVQCFSVGIELPRRFFRKHWSSLALLLGPVMAFSWLVCAVFIRWLFRTDVPTALIISACLTPTDPVLAASVLSNSQFSERVPARIRHLLSAESGCNDGTSFPFLYVGLSVFTSATVASSIKKWVLITLLWQCAFGIVLGLTIGHAANRVLRFSDKRGMIGRPSYVVFYLLLALFCVGVGSTLGSDDFLVAFSAGVGFAHDGWFASATAESNLATVIDLLVNSTMFVYFGASIPWSAFNAACDGGDCGDNGHPHVSPRRLIALFALVLAFRRIPAILALKPLIKDIKTWREALFCGHFGPMGVGALFLAMEARAQLETETSEVEPHPPQDLPSHRQQAVSIIWPIICFVVLGSTMVHGLSTLVVSVGSHYSRKVDERAPLIGAETERLYGMVHEEEGEEEEREGDAEEEAGR